MKFYFFAKKTLLFFMFFLMSACCTLEKWENHYYRPTLQPEFSIYDLKEKPYLYSDFLFNNYLVRASLVGTKSPYKVSISFRCVNSCANKSMIINQIKLFSSLSGEISNTKFYGSGKLKINFPYDLPENPVIYIRSQKFLSLNVYSQEKITVIVNMDAAENNREKDVKFHFSPEIDKGFLDCMAV